MASVYLALGANEGDRKKFLQDAVVLIQKHIGLVGKESSVYETASWGYEDADYLNMVLFVETSLTAKDLLKACLAIEKRMGRKRQGEQESYTARCIDVDILYYDNFICEEENLSLPHPRLHQRRFVLEPLVEIAPTYVHPYLKKTHRELLEICGDQLHVKHYE